MFVGHYAVGSAARALLRRGPASGAAGGAGGPSLGAWFLAVQWLDLVWPVLVLLGIERVRIDPGNTAFTPLHFVYYPWSHSLLAAVAWGAAFAAVYRWRTGDGRGGAWLGAGVLSHWVLDWISHRADLPLYPGGSLHVGLGLWHSVPATLVVEGGAFVLAVALYSRHTRARDRTGTWAWWGLVALLAAAYLANLLGPPPPGAAAVAAAALGLWLFVAWAFWVERHRSSAVLSPRQP